MSLKDSVGESIGWARRRLDKLRRNYMDVIHEAERQGGSRLDDIRRQVDQLGPGLRHVLDEQLDALQHKLDEINQRLAEEAVPEERKSRVGRLALERKAASAAKMASSVVRSRTRRKALAPGTSKASTAASAKAGREGRAAQNADPKVKPRQTSKPGKQTSRKSRKVSPR